jgi:hypothetical protein
MKFACVALAMLLVSMLAAQAQTPSRAPAGGSYTGPGSCAASSCHGSVRPVAGSRIAQTEYGTWVTQDRHAKAMDALATPLAQQMARLLDLPRPETAARCLACHSVVAPEASRARTFTAEGVSCEACHGPASGWLGPHTTRGWTHAQSVAAGMFDTKDLVRRTEKCASCHVGTGDAAVDHELIAAGHPDLVFDLEAFSGAMPRHWPDATPQDPWQSVRAWSVGQMVVLREGLDRLARATATASGSDFAELDCFACHHALTRPESSWRQAQGYAGRRPGSAPWNHARVAIARLLARALDPAQADQLDASIAQIDTLVSTRPTRAGDLSQTISSIRPSLDALAQRASTAPIDAAFTRRMIDAIVGDATRVAAAGERSAEQAAMSLEVLIGAYAGQISGVDAKKARAALDHLLQQLENPSAYDPRRFALALEQVTRLLP